MGEEIANDPYGQPVEHWRKWTPWFQGRPAGRSFAGESPQTVGMQEKENRSGHDKRPGGHFVIAARCVILMPCAGTRVGNGGGLQTGKTEA